ncbi:MAG: hypothetical protein M3312_07635 [Actinomycetota bacterium]|nr:hypothetical protein [Actinomycetota bacterium]
MRLRLAVALLALAAVSAAACSGGGNEVAAEQAIAAAPAKTARAGSYRTDFSITTSGITGKPVKLTGEGIFDAEKRAGRMTLDMSRLGAAVGRRDLGVATIVFERLVVYLRLPFLRELQPKLKPWLALDLQKLGEEEGIDLGGLEQLGESDPSRALAYLRGASGKVEEVGQEEIRGARTTHYRMTVDLHKAARRDPSERESLERVIERSGVQKIPADVWVDDAGRVRRLKLAYENVRLAPGQEGDLTMRMDLFDFGVDVDVAPPPAGRVTDVSDLAARSPGGS